MKTRLCTLIVLLSPVSLLAQEEALVRLDLESNVETVVLYRGVALKLGEVHKFPPGSVTLTVRFHDGESECEEELILPCAAGKLSCFTLTLRVRVKSWLV